jgi:formylglycine-generating enzyme required for sulfatase activity/uncharacterized caspase-like protein
MRRLAALAFALIVVCFALTPSHAEKRVALVIGNSAYPGRAGLTNPVNDAVDVTAALRSIGFEVLPGTDLSLTGFAHIIDNFREKAKGADVALVYYAGHAMQFEEQNWLMPIDTRVTSTFDVRHYNVALQDMIAEIEGGAKTTLVFLDACRDNPLDDDLKARLKAQGRSYGDARGLARLEIKAPDTLVVFATRPNTIAADGQGRRNSPFTEAFLENVAAPGIEIEVLMKRVTASVAAKTQGKQEPERLSRLKSEFYFVPTGSGSAIPGAILSAPSSEASQAWADVKDTKSQAMLEEFIKRFGDSFYAALARVRLEELKKGQVAAVAPPVVPASPCGATPMTVSWSSRSAQPLLAGEECALKPKDVFKECDKCPEMVVVPAGRFTIGSPTNESGRYDAEGPQYAVSIAKPYAAGKFHITLDQFGAFVAETGYDAGSKCQTYEGGKFLDRQGRSWRNPGFAQNGSHPAVCLNWNDAKAYVGWLTKKTGKSYRLLTETEWEYAARAGSTTRYFFGDEDKDFCLYGNGADQSTKNNSGALPAWAVVVPCNDGYVYTSPVGNFLPNAFGLYDMHGNAWQWLEDCWHQNYQGAPSDGSAWTTGDCGSRVLRGGNWGIGPAYLRAASRMTYATAARFPSDGFRVARTLAP